MSARNIASPSSVWACLRCSRRKMLAVVMLLMAMTASAMLFEGLLVRGNPDYLRFAPKKTMQEPFLRATAATEDSEDLGEVFAERREMYQKVCRAWEEKKGTRVPGHVRHSYIYLPANFSLCGVPKFLGGQCTIIPLERIVHNVDRAAHIKGLKVGVTFWKRVFFFLYNRTGRGKAKEQKVSPMEIDRQHVHTHKIGGGSTVTVEALLGRELSHVRRVLFSRDPWSRLWSAYVDKCVLPDSWVRRGPKIVALRNSLPAKEATALRQQSELEKQLAENEKYSRTFNILNKTKCPDDITFAEFLRFAAINNNPHWSPVHAACNPCVYQPHLLGKMETFGRDTAYILETVGLTDRLKLHLTHSNHVLDELKQLTNNHYTHFKARPATFESCLDFVGVARRLWRAFQLNGYIPADHAFPADLLEQETANMTEEEAQRHVVKTVQQAHLARPLGAADWAALKRRNMVAAYRSVPKQLLLQLLEKFQLDFELFQYDKKPADIFGTE